MVYELLDFALQDVELRCKLASFIYHYAVKRGLMDLMKLPMRMVQIRLMVVIFCYRVRTCRGLRLAGELGGAMWRACENAAKNGHVECLRVAHEFRGKGAAMNGRVECLRVAKGSIRDACGMSPKGRPRECLGGSSIGWRNWNFMMAANGHSEYFA